MSLRRSIFALGVAGFLATPNAFAETTFSPEELEKASFQSLQQGDPVRALAFAEALMARDGTDVTPHLLRARALRDLGRHDDAQDAARTAWKLSRTQAEKFSSALIMAQTLSSDNKRTRAQLWLRRAVEHAPSPQLANKAKRDFKYVQQRNPWQTYLSFTLAPNSNVNNGSARDSSRLNYVLSDLFGWGAFDLTGSSQALSGVEIGGDVQTRYRFSQTATTAHDLRLSLSYRTFILSGSARDILREARDEIGSTDPLETGSDFAFGTASVGYRFQKLTHGGTGEISFDTNLGQSWYGGNPYATFVRSGLTQMIRTSPDRKFTFGLDAEVQQGQLTSDTRKLEVFSNMDTKLASGNGMFLALSMAAQTSNNQDAEYSEIELRSGFSLGRPVMGAALQFGLGASYRDYDVSRHDPAGREDLRVTADITAVFREIDYYGFNPSVTLSASSTASNINLYDSNRIGLSLGIRSAF